MKTLIKILFLFLVTVACKSDDDNCISYKSVYVSGVNAPATGTVNEKIVVEVSFVENMGCEVYEQFIETTEGNSITIEIETKNVGCICTTAITTHTVYYEFTPQTSGDYELKFKSGLNEFIIATIAIN